MSAWDNSVKNLHVEAGFTLARSPVPLLTKIIASWRLEL